MNKQDNVPQVKSVEDYRHMTEIEILNLPKDEHKELFLTYRMPEGYNPVRDRKTIMFLEAMFRDGYEIGSGWQKNQDASRIAELEDQLKKTVTAKNYVEAVYSIECKVEELQSENAKLREALENIEKSCDGENPHHETAWRLAFEALKGKEAKGE